MNFFIKESFSKCDQIRKNQRIWSHVLNKLLMENFIFCAVRVLSSSDSLPTMSQIELRDDQQVG